MFQKKGVGTRRLVFLAASPLVTAPPVKSHSTILQQLRHQVSLDYYTIPPATQAMLFSFVVIVFVGLLF